MQKGLPLHEIIILTGLRTLQKVLSNDIRFIIIWTRKNSFRGKNDRFKSKSVYLTYIFIFKQTTTVAHLLI